MDKVKWNDAKQKVKAKALELQTKAKWFWYSYEEEIIIVSAIALPAAVGGIKAVSKAYTAHKEEQHRLLTEYDPSTGWYNELKRPLTTQDKANIMALRKSEGITVTEALLRLNLLK